MVVKGWVKYATVDWKKVSGPHIMHVPIANLRRLLHYETLADDNTEKRFKDWAQGKYRDVRFEADTRIASEMKGGFVPDYNNLDLYDISNEAKSMEKDHPRTAELIYSGLIESIGIHINIIDDSFGTFWPLFEECMEDMGNCIKRQDISDEDRRWRIEYLADWSLVVFSDFMEYYVKLLTELCTDVADLNVWKRVLEEELSYNDIDDRTCNWAVNKKEIEAVLAQVQDRIRDAGK